MSERIVWCEKCMGEGLLHLKKRFRYPYTSVTAKICDCENGERLQKYLDLTVTDSSD